MRRCQPVTKAKSQLTNQNVPKASALAVIFTFSARRHAPVPLPNPPTAFHRKCGRGRCIDVIPTVIQGAKRRREVGLERHLARRG